MHFFGISTTLLLQAGAGLAAVVVALYILRLRRRPASVPFAKLWQRVLRDKESSALFSQLRRLLSLLLQLLLLGLLLLALADPRPSAPAAGARHLVVLVDASASMKATDVGPQGAAAAGPAGAVASGPRSRLELAREKVRELGRSLSGADAMLVAQMDAALTPLSSMTSEPAEIEQAARRLAAVDVRAALAPALRFALDALRALSRPEIVVVSDGALGEPSDAAGPVDLGDVPLSFVPVGKGGRNVAVTGFAVRRYPLDKSRYEVMLEATNAGDEPEDVELELYGDGELSDIVALRLGPHESRSRFYPNLSGASRTLEARIALRGGGRDVLPADDRAFALLPERRRARVQLVTAGNTYLEAALLLDEYLEVVTVPPGRYPAAGAFDVTIFDSVGPALAPHSGHVLYLNPSGEHLPFKLGPEIKSARGRNVGFDELDAHSPLLRHVSLGDVNVARAHVLEGTKEDRAVGRSERGALLLQGRRQGTRFVALGFDIRESDLPLRIAWPLLLLNVISDFIEEDIGYVSSLRTGDVWHVPAPGQAQTGRLRLPDGSEQVVPIKDGRAVFLGRHAGFYTLLVREGAEERTSMFAANMSDPVESAVKPATELRVGARQAGELAGFAVGARRRWWIYLIGAALLITALEWLGYHRRVTV
ncbi:MAG: VWA domain-containing protein [Deltaproteobacteria bacterium]|nr:VWA domain-containing protein [Deltaproteobacteria bacterium]